LAYNPDHVENFNQAADFDCVQRQPLMFYADAEFAGEVETRKSTTGYILFYQWCTVIWRSGPQSMVATSTTEAEMSAAATARGTMVS
jgi:hypothetical protein